MLGRRPMGRAGGTSSAAADIRDLWDSGPHAEALQEALRDWDRMLEDDGAAWLQSALRAAGLEAGAFALEAEACRRNARAAEWETLIASLLRIGDPWWARELLEEAGT